MSISTEAKSDAPPVWTEWNVERESQGRILWPPSGQDVVTPSCYPATCHPCYYYYATDALINQYMAVSASQGDKSDAPPSCVNWIVCWDKSKVKIGTPHYMWCTWLGQGDDLQTLECYPVTCHPCPYPYYDGSKALSNWSLVLKHNLSNPGHIMRELTE